MKRVLFSTAVAVFLGAAGAAQALTYNWTFEATDGTHLGQVTGTISGLEIGDNDSADIIATVNSSPSGLFLGVYDQTVNLPPFNAATVNADKEIVFLEVFSTESSLTQSLFLYKNNGTYGGLLSGPDPSSMGSATFSSYLPNGTSPLLTFELVNEVPLPNGFVLMIAGLGGLVLVRKTKH